jgi:protein TonB
MAVQIFNDMPDAEVHRGDAADLPSEPRSSRVMLRISGRAMFMGATIGLHVVAAFAFMGIRNHERTMQELEPIMATMLDQPPAAEDAPPVREPPIESVVYAFPTPPELSFESDTTAPEVTSTAIAPSASQAVAPPMIETVEYVRAPAPVYPTESSRKRERGTVLLRVLVDSLGRPAQIQIERSSGYTRLDSAAREAVRNALFRPHEVNGIAQPSQVLIPIEFTRRST